MGRVAGLLGAFFLSAQIATPCVCIGEWPDFNHAMLAADSVLVGEVTAQGKSELARFYPDHDVAYIDLRVLASVKGDVFPAHVRIWDSSFGTDCSYDLRPFRPGSVVALAVQRNSVDREEYWRQLHLSPATNDQLLGGCGDYHKLLGKGEDAAAFADSARKWLRTNQSARRRRTMR